MDSPQTFEFKTEPFKHQREIWLNTRSEHHYGLFLEMGLGKTKICIDTIAWQYQMGLIEMAIVVAPKRVYGNWSATELPIHMPDNVEYDVWTYQGLKTKKEERLVEEFIGSKKLKIVLLNYDAVKIPRVDKVLKQLTRKSFYTLIADESTKIKNTKTKTHKAVVALARSASFVRILTGTPLAEGPIDIWGQLMAFNNRPFGMRSFVAFRSRYCKTVTMKMGNRSFEKIVGVQNINELERLLSKNAAVLTKDKVLDLPPKIFTKVPVEWNPEQARAYTELRDRALTYINDHEITGANALAIMMRLHQITCGQIKTEEGYERIENNRIETCSELIAESASKVVVWCHFKEAQNALYDALRPLYGAVRITAGMTEKALQETLHNFRTLPAFSYDEDAKPEDFCKVLIANPMSAGHGITLVEAQTVIYYSNPFSLELRLQSEDRCHRIGQTGAVNYYDLFIPKTVDVHVLRSLAGKKNFQNQIMNSPHLIGDILNA